MNHEQLLDLLDRCKGATESFYTQSAPDFCLQPMYILTDEKMDQTEFIMVEIADEPEERSRMVRQVRQRADAQGLGVFVWVSEGWTLPRQNMESYMPGERISERPDRVEVVLLEVGDRSGTEAVVSAVIVRSGDESARLKWGEPCIAGKEEFSMQSRMNIFNSQIPDVEGALSGARGRTTH